MCVYTLLGASDAETELSKFVWGTYTTLELSIMAIDWSIEIGTK